MRRRSAPPRFRASAVEAGRVYRSRCRWTSVTRSTRSGANVPRPTCRGDVGDLDASGDDLVQNLAKKSAAPRWARRRSRVRASRRSGSARNRRRRRRDEYMVAEGCARCGQAQHRNQGPAQIEADGRQSDRVRELRLCSSIAPEADGNTRISPIATLRPGRTRACQRLSPAGSVSITSMRPVGFSFPGAGCGERRGALGSLDCR